MFYISRSVCCISRTLAAKVFVQLAQLEERHFAEVKVIGSNPILDTKYRAGLAQLARASAL
jgi:hypothetical protein